MSLLPCPECGREISDQAAACPHCGYPIQDHLRANADVYTVLLVVTNNEQEQELAQVLHLTPQQIQEASQNALAGKRAPIASNLTKEEADALVAQFSHPDHFKVRSNAELADQAQDKPMTFESTMGAVILGVIAAVVLLSFL